METELERRVSRLEARLDVLQGFSRATPPPPPPPPKPPAPRFDVSPPEPPKPSVDTEYQLGATIMPRIGGGIVVLGLGTLVSIGIRQGWITPAMLFGAVCALCVGLIALGVRIRDEREQFGHLLTAVGSCGLYLNFAAGALVQNLYPDGVMVALFAGLSLVNVAWGFASRSQVFLTLGLLGGLAAAWFPLPRTGLASTLHFLILIPSLLVAWKHRWEEWTVVTASAGLVSALVIGGSTAAVGIPLLYATGALGLLAFAMSVQSLKYSAFAPVLVATSLVPYFNHDLGIHPSLRLLPMAGLFALIGQFQAGDRLHGVIVKSAAWTAAVLVPATFNGVMPAVLYFGEAAVFAAWVFAKDRRSSLPWIPLLLGMAATGVFQIDGRADATAGLYALGLAVLLFVGASGTGESKEAACLLSTLWAMGMAVPLATLTGQPVLFVGTLLMLAVALIPTIWAHISKDLTVGRTGYAALLLGWIGAWMVALDGAQFAHESILFASALLVTVVVAHVAVVLGEARVGANLWTLTALASATTRLAYAAHENGMVAGSLNGLITATWIGLLVVAFGVGFWRDRAELRYAGFSIATITVAKVILVDLAATDPLVRVGLLLTLGGVLLAFGHQYIRRQRLSDREISAG